MPSISFSTVVLGNTLATPAKAEGRSLALVMASVCSWSSSMAVRALAVRRKAALWSTVGGHGGV